MANMFFVPGYIVVGDGALKSSADYMRKFGRKPLIVTDDMMLRLGNVSKVTAVLDEAGINYEVYHGVNSEPDNIMVDEGVRIYREKRCDFLIGLGGGSPIDASKAIGVVAANGGSICDYINKEIKEKLPPVVAIPTTAGTGSEATRVAVIKDTEKNIKMMLSDLKLLAALAVVDPVFTLTAPPSVTVNTGVDALCHAIESHTSRKSFPLSKLYSIDAVKKIFRNLPLAYKDGGNIEARKNMAEASLEAGIAFSNASVSLIHGMSRPVGALFHIPHGLSNALLLKVCLPYLKKCDEKGFCDMAKELGIYKGNNISSGAEVFVKEVNSMLAGLNISTLEMAGVNRKKFFEIIPKMAEDALASGSPQNCKIIPGKSEICDLYARLW